MPHAGSFEHAHKLSRPVSRFDFHTVIRPNVTFRPLFRPHFFTPGHSARCFSLKGRSPNHSPVVRSQNSEVHSLFFSSVGASPRASHTRGHFDRDCSWIEFPLRQPVTSYHGSLLQQSGHEGPKCSSIVQNLADCNSWFRRKRKTRAFASVPD
uniref:(northern house mosquito) hypothetical protein n=1 Tax=Culex pipiens TaxID=7175 RepID=A0A8D8H6K9_CULPI